MSGSFEWLSDSTRYAVLLAVFLLLVLARLAWMGARYLSVPGGLITALTGLFTASDIVALCSDQPNTWPASFFVDPYELREKPLALLLVAMLLFWLGESLVFSRRSLREMRVPEAVGDVRETRILGRIMIGTALVAQVTLFGILGVSSLSNFLSQNGEYGFRIGSEGLGIFQVAFNLLPIGLALAQDPAADDSKTLRSVIPASLAVAAGFFLTASKAGAVVFLLQFLLASYWREGRMPRWSVRPAVVATGVALAAISLALKTQIKYGGGVNDTSRAGLTDSFHAGAGRFEGGTFQTYCVILREFAERKLSYDGSFHLAVFTNTVPRVLWPGKPLSPISHMMAYLGGGNDLSGAAITAPGAYFIDWGIAGVFGGMLVSGLIYGFFDRIGTARNFLQVRTWLSFTMMLTAANFYEGGFVGVVPSVVGMFGLWGVFRLATAYFAVQGSAVKQPRRAAVRRPPEERDESVASGAVFDANVGGKLKGSSSS